MLLTEVEIYYNLVKEGDKMRKNKLQKLTDEFSEICKKALPVLFKFAVDPIVIPKEKQKLIKKILRH